MDPFYWTYSYICWASRSFKQGSHWKPKINQNQISKTLSDLYVQESHNKVTSSSKGKNYTLFKQDLNYENYLIILNRKHCSSLLKFRLSNHLLPVETGRWENTPLEDRKCTLCSKHDIGDEFHYLFVCDHFISDRKKYLRSYFYKSPNIIKFKELFLQQIPGSL